jgi:aryl-alcohol dehydrogenase-like predicted oxidoreductase
LDAIEKRRLGSSALQVSIVGLGGNNFGGRIDFAVASRVVHKAIDLGINLVDTADTYGNKGGSEAWLGRILGGKRKDVVLATKFGLPMDDAGEIKGASRRYIMRAVEASLKRLNTDWIDLYQLHRPDPQTPIEETLRALDDLMRAGKVRWIGCSNLSAREVAQAHAAAQRNGVAGFISCQDEYSLLVRDVERELVPAAKALGMGFLPYFPLASGLLSGKYQPAAPLPPGSRLAKNPHHAQRFASERNWRIVEDLAAFAARRGRSLLELAFSWLLRDRVVASVIAGATTEDQVEQNARAANWCLSAEDLAEVDRITSWNVPRGDETT